MLRKGRKNSYTIRTPERRALFISALRETKEVQTAARLANVNVPSMYNWRRDDSTFAADWRDALIPQAVN